VNRRQRKNLTNRLMAAVRSEDTVTASVLLGTGADPNAADRDGTTPLYLASVHGAAEVVRLLLAAGATPDTESGRGEEGTPLCAAAAWGHTTVVQALLAHGADPNLREDQGAGMSPLEWALRGGHSLSAELLLAGGAQPSVPTEADITGRAACLPGCGASGMIGGEDGHALPIGEGNVRYAP
jgi:ankyrin repeat protein